MSKCARDPSWEGTDSLGGCNMPSSLHFRCLSPHKEAGLQQICSQICQWLSPQATAYLCTGNWWILKIWTFQNDKYSVKAKGNLLLQCFLVEGQNSLLILYRRKWRVSKFSYYHTLFWSILSQLSLLFLSHWTNTIWLNLIICLFFFYYLALFIGISALCVWGQTRQGWGSGSFKTIWLLGTQCLTPSTH